MRKTGLALTRLYKLQLSTKNKTVSRCIVSDILDLLNLTGSRNTKVEHMSGGEQKRLSIGLELITNPPIMFFDEPTSGLDSVSSAQVIKHLRSLARSGRAVACVIHQPSSQLCHLFDDVMLLASGRILYSGSINQMVPIFEEAGFIYPKDYNRADFVHAAGLIKTLEGTQINNPTHNYSAAFQKQLFNRKKYMLPSGASVINIGTQACSVTHKITMDVTGRRRG